MGREVRRVPPNWEHPRQECKHSPWSGGCDEAKRSGGKCYKPLMQGYADAKAGFEKMLAEKGLQEAIEYYGGAPDVNDYVPEWSPEQATWFQVYETVSEGTPVSPPFATREELVDYLVTHGDFWAQHRGRGGYSRKAAEAFVKDEWAPSMIVSGGRVMDGVTAAGER